MVGPVEIVVVAFAVGFAVALCWSIYKTAARREQLDDWAGRHGVALTDQTRPMVAEYLTRSRKFRLAGALIGLVLPLGTKVPGFEMAAGYLLGALTAEFTQKRLGPVDGARTASLARRVLEDYLPSYVTWLLRGAAVTAALLVALFFMGPRRSDPGLVGFETQALIGGILIVILPLVIELLLRRMVVRPQTASSQELAEADDAIRASSIHAVAAAGVCASLLMLGPFTLAVGLAGDVDILRWLLPAAGVAFFLTGVVIWFRLGPATTWKVRRNSGAAGAQA